MWPYLRTFVIATAAPSLILHFGYLATQDPKKYTPDYHAYSFGLPLYFGFMAMLALYLGHRFQWSLRKRLFVISIASILLVHTIAYTVMRHRAEPYQSFTSKGWMGYNIRNGLRHLFIFNVWMWIGETYWKRSSALRIWILASSAVFYLYTFWRVGRLEKAGHVRYNYRTFTAIEPWIQGFGMLAYIMLGTRLLGLSLRNSLVLWALLGSVVWYISVKKLGTYRYTPAEWPKVYRRVVLTRLIKAGVFIILLGLLQ